MDEEEQKKAEGKEKEEATPGTEQKGVSDSETGDKPRTTTLVDDANTAAERLEKANERTAELVRQEEELQSRKEALNALGGGSPAGTKPEPPKRMTDTEYAEALEKGEVNPLKEDGLI